MTSHHHSPKSLLSLCLVLGALFLFSAGLGGCLKQILPGGDSEDGPGPVKLSPLDEGRAAFNKGDYGNAEAMALRLVSDSALSEADRAEAGRLLTASALRNKHPNVAVTGLEHWRKSSAGADGSKEWQDAWCLALRALSSHDARTRANELYQDTARSASARGMAGIVLAVRQWEDGELGQSMAALENIHASAQGEKEKAALEGRLAVELNRASPAAAALVAASSTPENRERFPYNLIHIDQLRRQLGDQATRAGAEAALAALDGRTGLADPSLLKGLPAESVPSFRISGQAAGQALPPASSAGRTVALILPQGGQYAAISGKIAAGAQAVCDELSASGSKVSLVVIDSDQPDWTARVNSLPKEAVVVGGPLRRDDYLKAKAQGLAARRVLFAFLPGLETGDEGRIAWRFFSSARDQADTLLTFTSRLGISGYGLFYPEDNFGRRMAGLFEERATATGGAKNIVKASYAPGDSNNWMAAAGKLVSANNSGRAFQAVFLPDSWKNTESIVPHFFYYNETRHVLMGTSLWEQGLGSGGSVSPQYYALAIFPGSWNSAKPGPAGRKLQTLLAAAGKGTADFWSGLGADFARLSLGLNLREGWTPASVNDALQNVSLDWSTAPIRWTGGLAAQRMFLFTPRPGGFEEVNEEAFRKAFNDASR